LLAVSALVGCGGSSAPTVPDEPAPPQTPTQACAAGDVESCLALRGARCSTDDRMWNVRYDGFFPLRVASGGMIRVDYLDSVLLGVNSADWLACMDSCPGTDIDDVCIPFRMPVAFNLDYEPGCEVTDNDAAPWQGHDARRLDVSCDEERTASLTYVPGRARVRDALIGVDAIGRDSRLARLNGLVVHMTAADNELFSVQSIDDATCGDFQVPAGYRVLAGADRFDELQLLHPRLDARFKLASKDLREDLSTQLLGELLEESATQLRERCAALGAAGDTADQLADCYDRHADVRTWLSSVFAERFKELHVAMLPQLDALMREEYVEPLCRHYAGAL
jgi:hypothetical protein